MKSIDFFGSEANSPRRIFQVATRTLSSKVVGELSEVFRPAFAFLISSEGGSFEFTAIGKAKMIIPIASTKVILITG